MEQFLFQSHHRLAFLEQAAEAEGLILLRPDSVQLEGSQPEGQPPGLGLVYRRAVQELILQ